MSPSSAIRPDSFQRAHNYHHLIARWRRVARAARVPLRPLAKAGTYTVYFLDYRPADASADRGRDEGRSERARAANEFQIADDFKGRALAHGGIRRVGAD